VTDMKDLGARADEPRTVYPAKPDQNPADPSVLEQSIVELDEWFGSDMAGVPTPSQSESMALVLHELKRLRAAEQTSELRPEWIRVLCRELMLSKMTHNFTFSRDEVIELLGGKLALLAAMGASRQSNGIKEGL